MNDSLTTLDSYPRPLVRTSWADDLYYYNPTIATDGSVFYVAWELWHQNVAAGSTARASARRHVARRRRRPDLGRAPRRSAAEAERLLGRHAVGRRLAPGRPDAARARGRRGRRARCGRPGDRAAPRPVFRRRRERSASSPGAKGVMPARSATTWWERRVDRPGHRTRGRPGLGAPGQVQADVAYGDPG